MHELIHTAGQLSLQLIDQSEPRLKGDRSVITKTDTAVSELARVHLADLLSSGDHILIDEEDPDVAQYLDQNILDKTTYIWSIDPIDGTRLYANKIPTYGLSIGLLKNLRPWMGIVYFPLLNELFYCDGEKSYFVQNAFAKDEKRQVIKPVDENITSRSIFFMDDLIFRDFDWDYKDCQAMMQTCAVVDLCWPSIGRACGSIFRSHLWDFAGSWPIFLSAGLNLRSMKTGQILDKVDTNFFEKDKRPWKTKDYYILSSERNYSIIKNKLTPRIKG